MNKASGSAKRLRYSWLPALQQAWFNRVQQTAVVLSYYLLVLTVIPVLHAVVLLTTDYCCVVLDTIQHLNDQVDASTNNTPLIETVLVV